jgi:uncharacterized glyoxalase superfamily protein PhnB
MFRVEHVAWQVQDPPAVAEWYGRHLGFRVIRKNEDSAMTHFLADGSGKTIVEIYNNPDAVVLDYASMHPLQLHIAFAVEDVSAMRDVLIEAGCTVAEPFKITPAGDQMVMLRDPWGFAVQLVNRARALGKD